MTDGSTSGVQQQVRIQQLFIPVAALQYGSLTIRLKGGNHHGS